MFLCSVFTGGSFPEGKVAGAWDWSLLYLILSLRMSGADLVCFHGICWDIFTFFLCLYVKFELLSSNWWSLFVGKSKEAEIKRINKELANIRSKFKGDKTLDGYQKKKYVCKLLFIFLLGHDIDFGHMEAVNLLSSNKYSEKQIVSINQLVLSWVKKCVSQIDVEVVQHIILSVLNLITWLMCIVMSGGVVVVCLLMYECFQTHCCEKLKICTTVYCVRLWSFVVMTLKMTVVCDVTPCSVVSS